MGDPTAAWPELNSIPPYTCVTSATTRRGRPDRTASPISPHGLFSRLLWLASFGAGRIDPIMLPRLSNGNDAMLGQFMDVYFSADIETDGPIPGPYSMLSFALVYAGSFDGSEFRAPASLENHFYRELQPISNSFQQEALDINGLDRDRLRIEGAAPEQAMQEAAEWIRNLGMGGDPVLVAYPLSFDWTWLYWYFVRFCPSGSPFSHSRCYDVKTAFSVKAKRPISNSGRKQLFPHLRSSLPHSHHALDDAKEQAEVFAKVFLWETQDGFTSSRAQN